MDDNEKQLNDKNIKVLRTYTSDMADVIKKNEISVIKIALAEKEKKEQENIYREVGGANNSKTFFVIGGIILIVIAIIGLYFLIQNKKEKEKEISQPIISNVETFIMYDSQSNIDVTNATNINDLLGIIKQGQQSDSGLIKVFFLTRKINNIPNLLTSNNFLSLIGTTAPGALLRSLSDKYLLGKYSNPNAVNDNDKSAMFLILETNNYSQAYISMLDWEKTMLKDLSILFNINILGLDNSFFEKSWKDIIINNKDVRVLYGENGEGILYYVFVNKNNFVITNSIETLKEVMKRLIIKNSTL